MFGALFVNKTLILCIFRDTYKQSSCHFVDSPSEEYLKLKAKEKLYMPLKEKCGILPCPNLNIRSISTKSTNIHSSVNTSSALI